LHPNGYNMENKVIANFVKEMRKKYNLTQVDLSDKSGVGLRFVRDLEQGKQTLRMDKLNQVLNLFGKQLGAVDISKDHQE
jgi:y4mF family transcriptional regulator